MFPGLETTSSSCGELISGGALTVPGYQRPYSWSLKEVGQLVDDVSAAAGLDGDELAEDDYFIGTIILLARDQSANGAQVRDIVDGQQRLLTLTILMAVVRDLGLPEDVAVEAGRLMFMPGPDGVLAAGNSRMNVREQDRDFFMSHVQIFGATLVSPLSVDELSLSQSAMLAARDHMANLLAGRTPDELARLFAYLRDRCHFVVIETADIDKAHRLFSVINDRGMPLQRDQILKAELLRQSPPDRRDRLTALWDRIEADLGDGFEDLFAHIRTAHGLTKPQIIESIRQLVARAGGPQPFVDDVFAPLATAYHRIMTASAPGTPLPREQADILRKLSRLSGEDWVPAAMLVLDRAAADPAHATMLLREIDRLAHALRLLCLGSKRRQSRFARVCTALRDDPVGIGPDHPAFALARDEVRAIQHHLKDIYTRSLQAAKIVLLRINDEISNDLSAIALEPSDVSIEHVLPQRPKANSNWRKSFADPEVRAACTASLGNLVLVTPRQNELAKNAEYDVKKQIYAQTADGNPPLAITREALAAETWDAECVREREARLLEILSRVLRIELRKGSGASQQSGQAASA